MTVEVFPKVHAQLSVGVAGFTPGVHQDHAGRVSGDGHERAVFRQPPPAFGLLPFHQGQEFRHINDDLVGQMHTHAHTLHTRQRQQPIGDGVGLHGEHVLPGDLRRIYDFPGGQAAIARDLDRSPARPGTAPA